MIRSKDLDWRESESCAANYKLFPRTSYSTSVGLFLRCKVGVVVMRVPTSQACCEDPAGEQILGI